MPWNGQGGTIDVQNDRMPTKLGLPGADGKGTVIGGNVVYTSTGAVDTVVQPTVDGGSRTLQIIKNSSAPHDYETSFTVPAGMKAVAHDDGSVSVLPTDDSKEEAGFFEAPWAKDAQGNDVPTSYKVVGNKLVQHVEFSAGSPFPIVIDPSWWSTAWKITKCAASIASFIYGWTPQGSSKKIIAAVRLIKKIGFKKTAKLIQTWKKRRKLTADGRKIVAAIMGYNGIQNNCKFSQRPQMLIALIFVLAETAILITYTVRRAKGADLPALNAVNVRNLLLAAIATALGYAATHRYDLSGADVVPLVVLGCVLPTQAATALGHTSASWARLTWLPAVLGGLAVGSVDPNAPWPW